MAIIAVQDLRWHSADKSVLAAVVTFDDGRVWPMCVHDAYSTEEGQLLWNMAITGQYGHIQDHADPFPAEPVPELISRRQFYQYLAIIEIISKQEALDAMRSGIIPSPLMEIVTGLDTEDARFQAEMLLVGADNFERLHPFAEAVRLARNWTPEQRDDFWLQASKI